MATGQLNRVVEHVRRLVGAPAMADESDRRLLSRFVQDHDQDAFAALVRRHGPMVFGVARRVLGNEHDAQDAFQGTFLVLARKAKNGQWRDSLTNWLHSVAYRLALQVRENVAHQRAIERGLADRPNEKRDDSSIRELCAALDEELNHLPIRFRAALICCYLKGQTRDQAATQCGWSLRTLDRRLHRGRELLRIRLLRRGMTLSAVLLVAGLSGHGAQAALPAGLVGATAGAAYAFGIHGTTACGVSASTVTMAERALSVLTVFKLKLITAFGVALTLITLGAGAMGFQSRPAEEPNRESSQGPKLGVQNRAPALAPHDKDVPVPAASDPLPAGAVAKFGNDRLKPIGNMMNLVFSPNGTKVASWSDETYVNNALCIWDTHSGRLVRRVDVPGADLLALEWLRDGKIIGVLDTGHAEPLVWDFAQETMIPGVEPLKAIGFRQIPPPIPDPKDTCYAINPDGRSLAVGRSGTKDADGRIVLRQLKAGVGARGLFTQRQLAIQPGTPALLRFTPDGTRLVAFSEPSKLTGKQTPAAQLVVIWEVATGKEVCHFTTACPTEFLANRPPVAVSNQELAIGLEDGSTSVWDLSSGTERHIATAHAGQKPGEKVGTMAIAFSPNGKTLVTGGDDGLVKVWEAANGRHIRTLPRNYSGVEALTVAPDNQTIAAGYDGIMRLWDANSGANLCPQSGHENAVRKAALSPDGKTAVTAGSDRTLRWWDTTDGRGLRKINLPDFPHGMAISPDGKTVLVSVEGVGLRSWSMATCQETTPVDVPSGIKGGKLLFTPNGRQLIAASLSNVFVLDWPGLKLNRSIELPKPVNQPGETDCRSVTVSPDSRSLITVAYRSWFREERGLRFQSVADGVVDFWDLATGSRVRRLAEGKGTISTASFTPDGRVLLTNGMTHTIPAQPGRSAQEFSGVIALLDPFAPRWLRCFASLQPRSESILRMSATAELAPDGRTLYVAYNTGEIRCYEVATGQLRRTLKGHRGQIYCLNLTPDGRRLISGGRDGSAVIWDVGLAAAAQPPTVATDGAALEKLWAAATVEDAPPAYVALASLAAMPEQSVKMLRQRFKPLPLAPSDAALDRIFADLDSNVASTRERATQELAAYGELAVAGVRNRLERTLSPEVRRRLEAFLTQNDLADSSPVRLGQIRAVELLEGIATPAAKSLLSDLAKGASGAPLTLDAARSLERLNR